MAVDLDADLVLEGGGVKGIGLVGAYTTLIGAGYRMHRIAGTSAGAIVGALIAADMPPDLMEKTMKEVDYKAFEDKGFIDHLGRIGKGASILFEKGIYEGEYLRRWLDGWLTQLGKATFGDLRIDDPEGAFPPEESYRLVVLASDVSRGKLVCLPWDYRLYGLDPDKQRVADAVRASMSIPIIYEPVQLPARTAKRKKKSYLVDGGMLSNYPISIFDRPQGETPRWPTFGLKLSARPQEPTEERFQVHGTLSFAKAMVGTMASFGDQRHIDDPAVLARTMFIDTFDVKATDFDLDEATQIRLFDSGQAAATKFLHGDDDRDPWDFDRYVAKYRATANA